MAKFIYSEEAPATFVFADFILPTASYFDFEKTPEYERHYYLTDATEWPTTTSFYLFDEYPGETFLGEGLTLWGEVGDESTPLYATITELSYTLGAFDDLAIGPNASALRTAQTILSQSDTITGNAVANRIEGYAGNDTLDGGGGNDLLTGGEGSDTAVFDGSSSDYSILLRTDGTIVVTDLRDNEQDTLVGMEHFQFADRVIDGDVGFLAPVRPLPMHLVSEDTRWYFTIPALVFSVEGVVRSATMSDGSALPTWLSFNPQSGMFSGIPPKDFNGKFQFTVTTTAGALSTAKNFSLNVTPVDDVIRGGKAADRIIGTEQNDFIYGGAGKDILKGGGGIDMFVFDTKPGKANVDRILDYTAAEDSVWLDNSIFKALGKQGSTAQPASLKKGYFAVASAARDKDDHIVYDKKTGALFYDADGIGGAAQVQIASLSKNLKMSFREFFVV